MDAARDAAGFAATEQEEDAGTAILALRPAECPYGPLLAIRALGLRNGRKTARFYADRLLPRATSLAQTITEGGDSVLVVASEQF